MKEKGYWSNGRLAIGIISIVLFLIISLQSCAAGIVNTIENNELSSGSQGFIVSLCLLVAGIVGICTKNSNKKPGIYIVTIFYAASSYVALNSNSIFGDLGIWGAVCLIFGMFYLLIFIKISKLNQ